MNRSNVYCRWLVFSGKGEVLFGEDSRGVWVVRVDEGEGLEEVSYLVR